LNLLSIIYILIILFKNLPSFSDRDKGLKAKQEQQKQTKNPKITKNPPPNQSNNNSINNNKNPKIQIQKRNKNPKHFVFFLTVAGKKVAIFLEGEVTKLVLIKLHGNNTTILI